MLLEYHAFILVAGLLEVITLLFCARSMSPFLSQYLCKSNTRVLPSFPGQRFSRNVHPTLVLKTTQAACWYLPSKLLDPIFLSS